MNKEYVLGFFVNSGLTKVVLIEKQHPDWQKGLLNGVGGKIEPEETPVQAMCREFKEETGLSVAESRWTYLGLMDDSPNGDKSLCVHIFYAEAGSLKEFNSVRTTTDETVVIYEIEDLLNYVPQSIVNLPLLMSLVGHHMTLVNFVKKPITINLALTSLI